MYAMCAGKKSGEECDDGASRRKSKYLMMASFNLNNLRWAYSEHFNNNHKNLMFLMMERNAARDGVVHAHTHTNCNLLVADSQQSERYIKCKTICLKCVCFTRARYVFENWIYIAAAAAAVHSGNVKEQRLTTVGQSLHSCSKSFALGVIEF